jgi:TolB-like protein
MLNKLIFTVLFYFIFSSSLWAGQVVTDDIRLWAKKVLEEEKILQPAEGRNTLAVLYFQNKTEQSQLDPLQKGIALMLITDLSKVKNLQVLERIKVQALIEEMGFGVSGLVEPHTAPRVGKLLGARWLIGGAILGKVPQIQIQSNPLEVPTQKLIGEPTAQGDLSDLFQMEKELLFGIIELLKITVSPEEEKDLRKPCSTNFKALMALFKGIGASDDLNYEKAAEFYETALKEDSNICIANEAREELRLFRIISRRKGRDLLWSLRNQTSITDQLPSEDTTKREIIPSDIQKTKGPCD